MQSLEKKSVLKSIFSTLEQRLTHLSPETSSFQIDHLSFNLYSELSEYLDMQEIVNLIRAECHKAGWNIILCGLAKNCTSTLTISGVPIQSLNVNQGPYR